MMTIRYESLNRFPGDRAIKASISGISPEVSAISGDTQTALAALVEEQAPLFNIGRFENSIAPTFTEPCAGKREHVTT